MLSQPLTYCNFYYNYTLFKLYNILVRGTEVKIIKDYNFCKGRRASIGPNVASPMRVTPTHGMTLYSLSN